MTMNCCPNSTNEILNPRRIVYNDDGFESYYLTADEVNTVFRSGKIPLMTTGETLTGRPKIAVVWAQEKHPDRTDKDYSLHPDYVRAVTEAGGTPYFIAYDKINEQLDAIRPDGIFLVGGAFNSPAAWYEIHVDEDVDKRGKTYLTMLDYAQTHKLPVLGICAGMQMLAGYLGAKMQKGINEGRLPTESHKQNGEKIAHKVFIKDGSLLSSVIGGPDIMTNSSHNEAVISEKCGQNFVTAQAEDGIVEAIEPQNGWNKFLLGVQWHPERLLKHGDAPSAAIFQSFIENCKHD